MKHSISWFVVAGLLMSIPVAAWSDDDTLLEADSMVGVDGLFLRADTIRGVFGAGAAWALDEASVELESDGQLEVEVEGLILPRLGFNPATIFFRALVSCLSVDEFGSVVTVNVLTNNGAEVMIGDPRNGDAEIEEKLDLPTPCIAPIVFVTSPGGAWFAVTGFDASSDDDSEDDDSDDDD